MNAFNTVVQLRLINPHSKEIIGYERLVLSPGGCTYWEHSLDGNSWDADVFEGDEWIRDRATGIISSIDGTMIYENDLVENGRYQNLVVFQRARFGLKLLKKSWGYRTNDALFPIYEKLRVIGNAHKDAALLASLGSMTPSGAAA